MLPQVRDQFTKEERSWLNLPQATAVLLLDLRVSRIAIRWSHGITLPVHLEVYGH